MPRNDRLRQQRIQHNWRQEDVAEQLGITVITIQRWERGSQQPRAHYRVKLCALFGISAQELGLEEEVLPTTIPESEVLGVEQQSADPTEDVALWTVPYGRNPHFTGRDELLNYLEQQFSPEGSGQPTRIHQAALTQAQALKGLGGIGKTQIAIEYAYRVREQGYYTHIIWITAACEETILTGFSALADLLPDFCFHDERDRRKLVAAIIRWLELCEQRWLLIMDSADDLSLVYPYLPRGGNGSILFTTRAHAVGSLASSVEVNTMSVMEGTQFLLRRAQRFAHAFADEIDEASHLVVALAQFPLALDQAGAYIEETGCNMSDYRRIYQEQRHALLVRRGRQTTGYPESVATTWSVSFQHAELTNPAAADLLRLCAFLAPDHIPEELLLEGAAYWPPLLQRAVADPFTFNQMLETLLTFSLVRRLSEDHLLSVHRMVQVVLQEALSTGDRKQWQVRVVQALAAVFPEQPRRALEACERLLPHVLVTVPWIEHEAKPTRATARLLRLTGDYLSVRGQYIEAEPLLEKAYAICEQQVGLEHLDTAATLHALATLYLRQGKYEQAEPLMKRVLTIREEQLGAEHPDTAHGLNNLALVYYERGKYEQAESLLKRALAIWEQHLGPGNPDTAHALHGLAVLYRDQGKDEQAAFLFRRALAIREEAFVPTHPYLAETLHEFAFLRHAQGQDDEARSLYERALAARTQTLGMAHRHTIETRKRLAALLCSRGRAEEVAWGKGTQSEKVEMDGKQPVVQYQR